METNNLLCYYRKWLHLQRSKLPDRGWQITVQLCPLVFYKVTTLIMMVISDTLIQTGLGIWTAMSLKISLYKPIYPATDALKSRGHVLNQPCSESLLDTLHSICMTTGTTCYIITLYLLVNNVPHCNPVPNLIDISPGLSPGVLQQYK